MPISNPFAVYSFDSPKRGKVRAYVENLERGVGRLTLVCGNCAWTAAWTEHMDPCIEQLIAIMHPVDLVESLSCRTFLNEACPGNLLMDIVLALQSHLRSLESFGTTHQLSSQEKEAGTMTLQEIWNASGGNRGIKPSVTDVLSALKNLGEICDERENS